jgi:hypothetical protein
MYEEREMVKAFMQRATGGFSAIVLTATIRTCVFDRMVPIFADKLPKETAESDNHMHDHFFPNQRLEDPKATVRDQVTAERVILKFRVQQSRLSWNG